MQIFPSGLKGLFKKITLEINTFMFKKEQMYCVTSNSKIHILHVFWFQLQSEYISELCTLERELYAHCSLVFQHLVSNCNKGYSESEFTPELRGLKVS